MLEKDLIAHLTTHAKEFSLTILALPRAQNQKGGTCGYYAMSIVSDYWHKKDKTYPFWLARKSDQNSDDPPSKSLRELGKPITQTLGAIFDVYLFKTILNQVGYQSAVYELIICLIFQSLKSLERGVFLLCALRPRS